MNSMNLSQTAPPFAPFSASFEQEDDDAAIPPPFSAIVAVCLGHRKKFRDPNSFKFASRDKPIKCNVFVWRMLLDRIPTKVALARRNINCGDGLCNFCEDSMESTDHLFTACMVTSGVWNAIASWVGLPIFYFFSVADIMKVETPSSWPKEKKVALYGVLGVSCWRIWRARNENIFNNDRRTVFDIVADIKALSFLWFSSRYKKGMMGWTDWNRFSFDVT